MQFINHDSTHKCCHLLYHNFFFLFIFEKWNKQVAFTCSISTLTQWTCAARCFSQPRVCRSKPEGRPPYQAFDWLTDTGRQGEGQPALQVFPSQRARSALGKQLRLLSSSLESKIQTKSALPTLQKEPHFRFDSRGVVLRHSPVDGPGHEMNCDSLQLFAQTHTH